MDVNQIPIEVDSLVEWQMTRGSIMANIIGRYNALVFLISNDIYEGNELKQRAETIKQECDVLMNKMNDMKVKCQVKTIIIIPRTLNQ
jgi:hypothetical protein